MVFFTDLEQIILKFIWNKKKKKNPELPKQSWVKNIAEVLPFCTLNYTKNYSNQSRRVAGQKQTQDKNHHNIVISLQLIKINEKKKTKKKWRDTEREKAFLNLADRLLLLFSY